MMRDLAPPTSYDHSLGIHSLDDYESLVDLKIFPTNKIPEEAHRSIANSLQFNNQRDLISGSIVEVQTYLSYQEQLLFLQLLFGAKVNLISENYGDNMSNSSAILTNNTALYLVTEINGKFQVLTGV